MNLKLHYNYKTSWCFISKRPSNWCSILELFTDDLYFDISRHAIKMAEKVKGFIDKGYQVYFDSPTNQQFLF